MNPDANSNSISIDDGRCQGHSRMEVMNPSERLFVLVFVVLCVCVCVCEAAVGSDGEKLHEIRSCSRLCLRVVGVHVLVLAVEGAD